MLDFFAQLWELVQAPYDALNWVADQGFILMRALFVRFGVPIVFLAALTEATVGLGVVFPGVVLMFLAGAYSVGDEISLALVLASAVGGTIIGDVVSYGLGRWGGHWLRGTRFEKSMLMGEMLISGHARWLIPFYHLHSVTRAVGPFGSGALRLPLRVWVPLDFTGAIIANTVWVGAGAILGRTLLTDRGTLNEHPALRIGLAVLAVVWLLVVQRTMRTGKPRTVEVVRADARVPEDIAG